MSRLGIVLAFWMCACGKKSSPNNAPPPPATDALWKLAPEGTQLGVVVVERALARVRAGALTVLRAAEKIQPEAVATVRGELGRALPFVDPWDDASLAAAGIDLERSAALFMVRDKAVVVLPVADRGKLVAKAGGKTEGGTDVLGELRCREVAGRYACTTEEPLLEMLGKSDALAKDVAGWPQELRGDIEFHLSKELTNAGIFPLADGLGTRFGVRIEPGGFTARFHWRGKPAPPVQPLPPTPPALAAGLADRGLSGIVILDAAVVPKSMWIGNVPATALPGGASLRDIVAASTGNLVGYVLPGDALQGRFSLGFSDAARVAKLLAACESLGLGARKDGDRCRLQLPLNLPGQATLPIVAWVETGAAHVAFGDEGPSAAGPPLPPFARELLGRSWALGWWGRGSALGVLHVGAANFDPRRRLGLWALGHLSELGVAARTGDDGYHALLRVRTTWQNPPDVQAALEPLVERATRGENVTADLRALAAKHPGSPLAEDVSAGHGSMLIQAGGAGIVAAIAIPAFMRNARKAKTIEAVTNVKRLYEVARSQYEEGKRFPTPSVGPSPPLGTCCAAPGDKCAPDAGLWKDATWKVLRFSMDDPHYYSYEYTASPDGRGFTATAYGDLDCDGVYSTFEMVGAVGADGRVTGEAGVFSANEIE